MSTLPAGEYYIGDPCYVIDDTKWMDFLDPYWDLKGNGGKFEFEGHEVCVFQTQWGDGCYPCSDGSSLGVDAGLIGAIPLALAHGNPHASGTIVLYNSPFECSRDDDGRMHFGDVEVMTGDEEEEGW